MIAIKMAKKRLISAAGIAAAQVSPNDPDKTAKIARIQQILANYKLNVANLEVAKQQYSKESIAKMTGDLATKAAGVLTAQNDADVAATNVKNAKEARKNTKSGTDEYRAADKTVKDNQKANKQAQNTLSNVQKEHQKLMLNIQEFEATAQGAFPEVASAATALKSALVNFECWQEVKTAAKTADNSTATTQDASGVGGITTGAGNGVGNDGKGGNQNGTPCIIPPQNEDDSPREGKYENGKCVASANDILKAMI